MQKLGLSVSVVGVTISFIGTLLLLLHVTSEYHSAIQDIGSIAVGYLGIILFGVSISVTGGTLFIAAKT